MAAPATPLVIHVIYALGTGGLENGLVNLINRTPPGRYRHAIICLTESGSFAQRITVPAVPIIALHKRPGHDPAMYWRLWRTLRRLRPAIVHTRNLAALETQVLGLLTPRTRRVHGEHGRDVHDLDGSNRRYRWLRRALAPLIQRFICVSRDLAQWLVEEVGIPGHKVVQLYNGVDYERFASPGPTPADWPAHWPADAIVVGTVGRLAAVKDQRSLIRALAHSFETRPDLQHKVRCIVVGDGPERPALEAAIAAAGLGEAVWLAGDRVDVPALLGAMDLFLLPSLGEGISNTVLEAMAAGLPVIATRVGGNPELVIEGQTGQLVPVGDPAALAAAMLPLLDDPAQRRAFGEAARQSVRECFDWSRTVAGYLAVYDEVLGRDKV
jgi:sugar transferase (PEP-CTERM/EpsH1 system associated)